MSIRYYVNLLIVYFKFENIVMSALFQDQFMYINCLYKWKQIENLTVLIAFFVEKT